MIGLQALPTVSMRLFAGIITSEHLARIFSGKDTHDPICRFAAQAVAFGADPDLIKRLVDAALPASYQGNSRIEVASMIDSALAKGFDKHGSKKEERPQFLDFVEAEVQLFHDEHGNGLMRIKHEGGGHRTLPLESRDADSWLRRKFFEQNRRALRSQELADIRATLQAHAEYEGDRVSPALRVGGDSEAIYVDLGRTNGSAVQIQRTGWNIVLTPPVHFIRSPGFLELPDPVLGGDIKRLQHLLNLDDDNWYRLLGFLLNAMRYTGPFMCLLVEGDQGSGKTFLAWAIKHVLDPNGLAKQKLTDSERDLMIQAKEHYVPVYDNVSGMKGDISDLLCTLATGGGFATRKLYTDAQQQVFNFCRAFVINGIADFANRPDLLERSILIRLPELPAEKRREEKEMIAEFREILPAVLGVLYSAVSLALQNESSATPPIRLRMADAGRWITAGEPAFGLGSGAIVKAIAETQSEILNERARNDVVVSALAEFVADHPIEATVGALHQRLAETRQRYDRSFPATPALLSRQLKRLRPAMAHMGMHVEFFGHRRTGTVLRVWRDGQEDQKARDLNSEQKY